MKLVVKEFSNAYPGAKGALVAFVNENQIKKENIQCIIYEPHTGGGLQLYYWE